MAIILWHVEQPHGLPIPCTQKRFPVAGAALRAAARTGRICSSISCCSPRDSFYKFLTWVRVLCTPTSPCTQNCAALCLRTHACPPCTIGLCPPPWVCLGHQLCLLCLCMPIYACASTSANRNAYSMTREDDSGVCAVTI